MWKTDICIFTRRGYEDEDVPCVLLTAVLLEEYITGVEVRKRFRHKNRYLYVLQY